MNPAKGFSLAAILAMCCPVSLAAPCPPAGTTREVLLELRARQFKLEGTGSIDELALALLPCLADRDPQLRDAVSYEALAAWMREKQIAASTAREILQRLLPQIAPDLPDSEGFAKPFAALVLAEVARMDRIDPFLSEAERNQLVEAATRYVRTVADYRGYDETVGWRHGVAHGADLLLQLSLNARVDADDLRSILDAVAAQIVPGGAHFYIYGESARLARPIMFAARRSLLSASEWDRWFARIAAPAPLASWDDAFWSQAGLAKRHNTLGFLNALYTMLRDDEEAAKILREPLVRTLAQIP